MGEKLFAALALRSCQLAELGRPDTVALKPVPRPSKVLQEAAVSWQRSLEQQRTEQLQQAPTWALEVAASHLHPAHFSKA